MPVFSPHVPPMFQTGLESKKRARREEEERKKGDVSDVSDVSTCVSAGYTQSYTAYTVSNDLITPLGS